MMEVPGASMVRPKGGGAAREGVVAAVGGVRPSSEARAGDDEPVDPE